MILKIDERWKEVLAGRKGGLVLFWKSSDNLTVDDSCKYYIDAYINKGTDEEWRSIGFYGELETYRQSEAWDKLRNLNAHNSTPWLYAEISTKY